MAADDVRKHLENMLHKAISYEREDSKKGVAALASCCPCLLSPKFQTLDDYLQNAASNKRISLENLYRLQNLLEVWQSKKGSYSPDSITFAFKFKSNLEKIIAEVKPAQVEEETRDLRYSGRSETVETGDPRWSDRSVNEEETVGFKERAMTLQRFLTQKEDESQFQAIGLVGMRGIGKTTLCQMIFDKPELRKFAPRIWVCLSPRRNDDRDFRKETVKRILVCLGVEIPIIKSAHESHDLQGLLFALRLQLAGKNYLIVLDDVWCRDENYMTFCSSLAEDERKCTEKLAYGLPKGGGGTVLFTSRIDEVAERMATAENLHRVRPLSDDDCWKIFRATVQRDGKEMSKNLESLMERIKKRCAGLPLSAKWLGEIARENEAKSAGAAPGNNLADRGQGQSMPSAGTH